MGRMVKRTDAQRTHLATYMRVWREKNKEHFSKWRKERYYRDLSMSRKIQRDQYRNSSKEREWYREYKEKNREKIKKYQSDLWRSPEGQMKIKDHDRKYWANPVSRMHAVVTRAFTRALKADLPFDQCLREVLKSNPPTNCLCCNVVLNYDNYNKGCGKNSPSLDRLEGKKGYVVGNAYILCQRCNTLKSNATLAELENIVTYMKKYGSAKEIREEVNESSL